MIRLFITWICFFNFVLTEDTCGCNVDRKYKLSKNHFLRSLTIEYVDQCPINLHDTALNNGHRQKDTDIILVPGGEYQLGTNDVAIESDMEGPKRMVQLNSFYLDKNEVSNKDFLQFVEQTDYKTEAEVFGDSFVFGLFLNSTFKEKLKDYRVVQATWWYKVFGADWRHPYGSESHISDLMDHPVVHVSWNDAKAYCNWRNARLPTEAEWEAACRGHKQDIKYPWGDKLLPGRKHMANIWQGTFPHYNSAKDGFIGTNPVHMFPQNDFGFHNIAGNVWEWTADPWTKAKPNEKVKKGGSYLCHHSYCYRYRCSARSHNTADSSAGNLGFRCAKSKS